MQEYEKLSDNENVGETANNMVAQAYDSPALGPVNIQYGDDKIAVEVNNDAETVTITWSRNVALDESVKALEVILKTSADRQQEEAGL